MDIAYPCHAASIDMITYASYWTRVIYLDAWHDSLDDLCQDLC